MAFTMGITSLAKEYHVAKTGNDANPGTIEAPLHTIQAAANSRQIEEQNIIGSHPVYQYLSEAYRLNIQSVHFEPNEMPSEDQWRNFDLLLEHHSAKIMLWEDEPMPEVKEILNKKGIHVCVFNPCGNKPKYDDFIGTMKKNIQSLQSAL